jgi:ankyrin repeat protein
MQRPDLPVNGQSSFKSTASFGKSLSKEQIAIVTAIEKDDLQELKTLLEANPAKRKLALTSEQLRFCDPTNGRNLLHIACSSATTSKALLEYLVSKLNSTADLNDNNNGKGTPMHLAASTPNLNAVKVLCEAGADPTIKNAQNLTPLEMAEMKRVKGIIKYLEERLGQAERKFEEKSAPREAHESTVGSKLEEEKRKEFNVNSIDWRVGTSEQREKELLEACEKGELENVRRLDELRVSFLCADPNGNQPLHLAARSGNAELVKFLISKGVCRQPLNNEEWTPLHSACAGGSLSTVKFLAEEALLDVDFENWENSLGVFHTNKKCIQFLVENRDRLRVDRQADTSDFCCVCSVPLSYKFGDSLEAVPTCSPEEHKDVAQMVKAEREYFGFNNFVVRQYFDPLSENISLFEMRFGRFKKIRCSNCKSLGMLCRCLSEENDSRRIRSPHIPFVSTKMSILLMLSNNSRFGSSAESPLNVLKNSPLFDVNVLHMIFSFMSASSKVQKRSQK